MSPRTFTTTCVFLFIVDVDATVDSVKHTLMINAEEAHDCRWFALTALVNDSSLDASVRRMIELRALL